MCNGGIAAGLARIVKTIREYKARGVMGDAEVGLESDIISVVFGG